MNQHGHFSKFFGTADSDLYGFTPSGRSVDGFPVRGAAPYTKADEVDQLPVSCDYRCKMFCMWNEQHVEEYTRIRDHEANGDMVVAVRREILVPPQGDEPGEHIKIWLEWKVLYATAHPTSDAINAYAGPSQYANITIGGLPQ
jgi:hypothetical protein